MRLNFLPDCTVISREQQLSIRAVLAPLSRERKKRELAFALIAPTGVMTLRSRVGLRKICPEDIEIESRAGEASFCFVRSSELNWALPMKKRGVVRDLVLPFERGWTGMEPPGRVILSPILVRTVPAAGESLSATPTMVTGALKVWVVMALSFVRRKLRLEDGGISRSSGPALTESGLLPVVTVKTP